jgi:inner membrane protein involved in colicin E2 resistance
MENIKYILINNRKIKYALLFIFLLIFLSAIIVLLTQNKIHKKNNRKTPESNIKSNKINK